MSVWSGAWKWILIIIVWTPLVCLPYTSVVPSENCEPPGGCWVLKLGPLEEQPVLSHLSRPQFGQILKIYVLTDLTAGVKLVVLIGGGHLTDPVRGD